MRVEWLELLEIFAVGLDKVVLTRRRILLKILEISFSHDDFVSITCLLNNLMHQEGKHYVSVPCSN